MRPVTKDSQCLVNVLRERFGPVKAKKEAYEKFLGIRQADNESCAAFASRFRSAITNLQRFSSVEDPDLTLHIFRSAINRQYRFMLHMDRPKTLSEAISSLLHAVQAPGVDAHSAGVTLIQSSRSPPASSCTARILDQLVKALDSASIRQNALQARLDSLLASPPPTLSSPHCEVNVHSQYVPGRSQFPTAASTRQNARRRPKCKYCGRTHRPPCSIQVAHQHEGNFFAAFCTDCVQPGHTFRSCGAQICSPYPH